MKKYIYIFLFLFICSTGVATEYTGITSGISEFDEDNIIVHENGVVIYEGDSIKVLQDSTDIFNYGRIDANIDINNHGVHIYNSGIINGDIITTGSGNLVQVIRSDAEAEPLSVIGNNFSVYVNSDFSEITLNKLKESQSTNFLIKNSTIKIDDFNDWRIWDTNITFEESNILYINNSYTVNSGEDIRYLSGLENISVVFGDADKLHKPQLIGTKLYIIRETNYEKIFSDDKRGIMLNLIRAKNPNDAMLMKLDSANNMDELRSVMNSSYHFNHGLLMKPVKILNNLMTTTLLLNDDINGAGVEPFYIISNKIDNFGARLHFGMNYDTSQLDIGINFNQFSYKDHINEFDGYIYGVDIKDIISLDDFWVKALIGLNFVQFDADYIYEKDKIKNDPFGWNLYAASDIGYDYNLYGNIDVAPFVGVILRTDNVMHHSEFDANLRMGGNIQYYFITDNIKYDYGFGGAFGINGDLYSSLNFGFLSTIDGIGATLSGGLYRHNDGISCQLSVNTKMLF